MKTQSSATGLAIPTTRLGFIGLGLMGSRLSARLHAAGWQVQTWNRSPRKPGLAADQELPRAASLADLCSTSDVLLSCLANDAAVEQVYLGDGGVLNSARKGSIVLEMSTISWKLSEQLHHEAAQRGLRMLDLPISGSTPAVEAGSITLLAGGDQATFDACTPIFESIARQWFLLGPGGSGAKMKLVVNLLLGVGMAAVAEAISLGQHLQLQPGFLLDVLSQTAVIAPAFRGKFNKISSGDYSPEFSVRLMSKDLDLVADAAAVAGAELPLAVAAKKLYAACADSIGDLDLSAITPKVAPGVLASQVPSDGSGTAESAAQAHTESILSAT